MIERYNLFRIGNDNIPIWLGSANSLDEARNQARFGTDSNWEVCVLDQSTGEVEVISNSPLGSS